MAASPNLQRKLQHALGAEAASDLLTWMQTMDAYRGEAAELRREMQVGFARIEGRMEAQQASIDGRMEALQAGMERMIEKALREQTRFFFLAWAVLLAAFIGLSARG